MGLGSGLAVTQGMFYYLGGRYDTWKKEEDEFERKETVRRTTRLPVEQTIAEIGEGRGKSRTKPLVRQDVLNLTYWQASDLLDMTSEGWTVSRRLMGSRSTLSARLSRVASEHDRTWLKLTEAIVHNSSGRRRAATLENWSFVLFCM